MKLTDAFIKNINHQDRDQFFSMQGTEGLTLVVYKYPSKSKTWFYQYRPGEKLHEQMISADDSCSTYEYSGYYKILPQINEWGSDNLRIKDGKKVPEGFNYSSENNSEWMKKSDFQKWIDLNQKSIGKI